MYNEKLSSRVIKKLTPTKWGMFKCFLKLGVFSVAATYYFGAIHTQIENNEKSTILSSIEEVIKDQYKNIKDPFLSLLKRAEGYKEEFYPDNKGYAVGYGYNPTQNSNQYNKSILDFAGVDDKTKEVVLKNSEKYRNENGGKVPQELREAKFTKEQLDKMAVYSQHTYERAFFRVLNHKLDVKKFNETKKIKILKAYTALAENKKAVLIHMTYKVGETNLKKYHNFFNSFINYLDNPSNENKETVGKAFTYKYAKNGVMLHDTRVEKLHHDLFIKEMPKIEIVENNKNNNIILKPMSNKEKLQLTEQDKFNKAMKEVNQQITLNAAFELLAKAVIKANDKFSKNSDKNNPQEVRPFYKEEVQEDNNENIDEDDEAGQYYESSSDVQNIIINGQNLIIKSNQSIQVINNGNKLNIKIR